ncbi:MAG: hypothetical protein HEQ23_16200 [Tepidisphaera sp.]
MKRARLASLRPARSILAFSAIGLSLTLAATRVDDARLLAGWNGVGPAEIAADPSTILTRRVGVSSVQLSISRSGFEQEITEREAFAQARKAAAWSTDPLAGMGAVLWNRPVTHQTFFRQGWPLHAFSASTTGTDPIRGGVLIGDPLNPGVLALTPMWTGLVGNTLLFGSASWVAARVPAALRRYLRRRSGRCENCGYARDGLSAGSPCPECGR